MTKIEIVIEDNMAKVWAVEIDPKRDFARVVKMGYDAERRMIKKAVFHFYLDRENAKGLFNGASYYSTMEDAMVAEDAAWGEAWEKAKAGW